GDFAPALFAERKQTLPLGGIDATVARAPAGITIFPAERSLHGRPRPLRRLQKAKRLPDDRLLHGAIPGMPARIAEREVGEQKARNAAMFDDVQGRSDDDRRNAVLFKMSGGQTHGLVADGSKRAEHSAISALVPQLFKESRSDILGGAALAVVGRH